MEPGFAGRNGQERGGFVSDARTGKRFPLELPIKIHNRKTGGEHSGVTGNLSAAGVYIGLMPRWKWARPSNSKLHCRQK